MQSKWFVLVLAGVQLCVSGELRSAESPYFEIQIVDDETARGVPLVELKTVNDISYWTDSAGRIAVNEPGLNGQIVFFHIASHGYEVKPDGFGYRGVRLKVESGARAMVKVRRTNIAERLYRVTGAGIYRDTVLLGQKPPLKRPLLNAKVLGSDSVLTAVYRDKMYWFWGDTNRVAYPLGNFDVPGATSLLPADGGLDPDVGVDLNYFVGENGFAKAICDMPGKGPTWIEGLTVLGQGEQQRMFATYAKIRPPLSVYERGIAEFDDDAQQFRKRFSFDVDAPAYPMGHALRHAEDGTDYIYFCKPLPLVRTKATAEASLDLSKYEIYSYFKSGSTADKFEIDRDRNGQLNWSWRTGTLRPTREIEARLIKNGLLKKDEQTFRLPVADSDRGFILHTSSIAWNTFRKRWVMIALEVGGESSLLGEVYYTESEKLPGPWLPAVKIVSHNKYSFYNPRLHPMLQKDGGRVIYFEGTYTKTFSGAKVATPRYDYNQIMYCLDLSDQRLRPSR
jgi:hypothetical protein